MRLRHLDPAPRSRPRAPLARPALVAGLLGALGVCGAALGATPVGSEFQINTYTTSFQTRPSVAVDPTGDFVVVWESGGSSASDTSGLSIQGQRYDASGNAVGLEFQVNTYTTDRQWWSSVAVDADGDFVVVWDSSGSSGSDSSSYSVQGQRYDADGNALGSEFQVNTYTTGTQRFASVGVAADGNFVVVWESYGSSGSDSFGYSVQGQRYDAGGNVVGSEFQVNTSTTSQQWHPWVAVEADGDFVVVWWSYASTGSDTSAASIQGQRYDAEGNAVGSEFQVNTYSTGYQIQPSVAVDADGDFVVVWTSDGSAGSDTSSFSIQGQRYDANGNAVGSEFQVNTYTTNTQKYPSVARGSSGAFVVAWTSDGSSGSDTSAYSVQGQRYDAEGNAVGSEFQVNTYTNSYQLRPSVSTDAGGNPVIVWMSLESAGNDTSQYSIEGQRYRVQALQVPSLGPSGVIGLALLLFGIAAVGLRGRLH